MIMGFVGRVKWNQECGISYRDRGKRGTRGRQGVAGIGRREAG
jgi:hypothetical protein